MRGEGYFSVVLDSKTQTKKEVTAITSLFVFSPQGICTVCRYLPRGKQYTAAVHNFHTSITNTAEGS